MLASDGILTQKDIISKTDLPQRTVRYALGRLKGEEMSEERFGALLLSRCSAKPLQSKWNGYEVYDLDCHFFRSFVL